MVEILRPQTARAQDDRVLSVDVECDGDPRARVACGHSSSAGSIDESVVLILPGPLRCEARRAENWARGKGPGLSGRDDKTPTL
jgi:hypothetical protein